MTIQQRQNRPDSLKKLAAQRYLYRLSKRYRNIDLCLIIFAGLISIYGSFINSDYAALSNAIVAITWFISQCFLTEGEGKSKEEAAAIQESFDCFVLDLPWPRHKSIPRPTDDRIARLAREERLNRSTDDLVDWYPPHDIPNDPLLSKIHCQRLNSWWDVELRNSWRNAIVFVLSVTVLAGVFTAALSGSTVAILLSFSVSLLRALAWVVREQKAQKLAVERINNIHNLLSDVSIKNRKNELSLVAIRNIQDEIFEHRRSNPPLPDWFYRFRKRRQNRNASPPHPSNT